MEQVRCSYLGVGAMLVGGLTTLWRLRTPIGRALCDEHPDGACAASGNCRARGPDLSTTAVLIAVALAIPLIFAICLIVW